jgi:hypothetical protein
LRDAAAVHRAVAAEVEATELRGAGDAAVVGLLIVRRDAQHAAPVRQIHATAGRRRPLVGVVGREQLRHLFEQVRRLGDDLVGCIGGAGVVLHCADRFDEPAVVGSAPGGGLDGAEIAAAMLLCVFGGHPIKLLLVARDGVPGVGEHPVGDA